MMTMSVNPKSFVHELSAKVYLDLETTLNNGYWKKMALLCRNGLGRCVFRFVREFISLLFALSSLIVCCPFK